MNTDLLDVAIIGAGSAGLAALRAVRKRTERFVLINDGPYGTTCARVGCMPSKLLIEAANAFHRRASFETFGIRGAEALTVDIPAVLRRVRELRDGFVAGTLRATADLGERNIAGRARLLAPDRIEVDGREIRARKIILATGSTPVVPESWRQFRDRVLTTDSLFEQPDLPPRVAVVGMGVVGLEISQALARLGLAVSGFASGDHLGGLSDPLVMASLRSALSEEFDLHAGERAELSADGAALRVSGAGASIQVDCVVAAMGRRPNVAGIGLESLGIELDRHGMPAVDPRTLRIGKLPVFLAGDANARVPLLHEAADEGHIASLVALDEVKREFRRRVPISVVFCQPNVAMIGKRFGELDPAKIIVGQVDFAHQGRARIAQVDRGILRLYADKASGRLLGAEMCAPAGEHFAHLIALAIERSLRVSDLLRMPFYHPTLEEGLRTALRDLSRQLPPCGDSDLAACPPFDIEALD